MHIQGLRSYIERSVDKVIKSACYIWALLYRYLQLTTFVITLTNYGWLKVNKDGPRHVLAGAGLAEECVEGVIAASDGLVAGHLAIRLDPVLQAVQLPTGIAHLHPALAQVDGDYFTLKQKRNEMF